MSEKKLAASKNADRNKAYRRALRLGWMLLISALLILLIPTTSTFFATVSMGYSLGAFVGWAILHYALGAGRD